MSEQIKPDITLPLKRVWFAKIWNGEKTVEYREMKPYWEKRIGSWVGDNSPKFVLFQIGYMKNGPRILVQVSNTDIGPCPYVGWCGNFYRIHFSIICPYWKQDGNFFPMGMGGFVTMPCGTTFASATSVYGKATASTKNGGYEP